MSRTVGIDQLAEAIAEDLKQYNQDVIEGIKKEAKNSVKQLVKETKATAPVGKRSKHYRDSITSKKLSESEYSILYLWYVKGSDYRLSHLLEKGHALRDGGRSKAFHFIQNATDPILEEYLKKVEEVLQNG